MSVSSNKAVPGLARINAACCDRPKPWGFGRHAFRAKSSEVGPKTRIVAPPLGHQKEPHPAWTANVSSLDQARRSLSQFVARSLIHHDDPHSRDTTESARAGKSSGRERRNVALAAGELHGRDSKSTSDHPRVELSNQLCFRACTRRLAHRISLWARACRWVGASLIQFRSPSRCSACWRTDRAFHRFSSSVLYVISAKGLHRWRYTPFRRNAAVAPSGLAVRDY